MNIVLINYTGERKNWGCQATSKNLLDFLEQDCLPTGSNISVVPLPNGHVLDQLHEAVYGNKIRKIYGKKNPTELEFNLIEQLAQERFGDYYNLVKSADCVIFQGEGSIGPSNYLRNVRLFGLPFLASRRWKKKTISLNQTLFAATTSDLQILTSIFDSFDIVSVREAASYVVGRQMNLTNKLVCCPDMAFREENVRAKGVRYSKIQPYFCITSSAYLRELGADNFSLAVKQISSLSGLAPVFLYSRERDRKLIDYLPANCQSISSADVASHSDLLSILASSEFVFGGRYHTAVSALSQTTPIILIPGNTHKSEGISDLIDIDFPVFNPSALTDIVAFAQKLIESKAQYRSQIEASLSRISRMQDKFASLFKQFILDDVVNVEQFSELHPRVQWNNNSQFRQFYSKFNMVKSKFFFLPKKRLKKIRNSSTFKLQIVNSFINLP